MRNIIVVCEDMKTCKELHKEKVLKTDYEKLRSTFQWGFPFVEITDMTFTFVPKDKLEPYVTGRRNVEICSSSMFKRDFLYEDGLDRMSILDALKLWSYGETLGISDGHIVEIIKEKN